MCLIFFSKKTFKNQRKPDPKKNFFQNYDDHLSSLFVKLYESLPINDFEDLQNTMLNTPSEFLGQVSNEAVKHLYLFDALRDGYDYFDEVVGATAIPLLTGLASLGLATAAIWEGMQALAIKLGLQQPDHERHLDKAAANILLAGVALVLSVATFMKSLISLVTRPLVTLIQGFKPQDVHRFTIDDSKEDDIIAFLNP